MTLVRSSKKNGLETHSLSKIPGFIAEFPSANVSNTPSPQQPLVCQPGQDQEKLLGVLCQLKGEKETELFALLGWPLH